MAVNINFNIAFDDLKKTLNNIKTKKGKKAKENEKVLKDFITSFYKASSFANEMAKKDVVLLDMYYPPELGLPQMSWNEFKRTNELITIPISLELFIDQLCEKFHTEELSQNQYEESAIFFRQIAEDFELQYEAVVR